MPFYGFNGDVTYSNKYVTLVLQNLYPKGKQTVIGFSCCVCMIFNCYALKLL